MSYAPLPRLSRCRLNPTARLSRFRPDAFLVLAASLLGAGSSVVGGTRPDAPPLPARQIQTALTAAITKLEVGKPVELRLATGEEHRYQVALTAGQYAKAIVEQRGIDVSIRLLAPDNRLVANFDREVGTHGSEEVEIAGEQSGNYTLVIRSTLNGVAPGSYEIRVAELRAATAGDRSLQAARNLQTEAASLLREGKYGEAHSLLERALSLTETVLGPEHVEVAFLLSNLADVDQQTRNLTKWGASCQRALEILERRLGPDDSRTARAVDRLGAVYLEEGDVARADPLLRRALEISERTLGRDHPQVALCLRDLAYLYTSTSDPQRAEPILKQALAIVEKSQGTENHLFADLLSDLGINCLDRDDPEGAEPLLLRSLRIREKLVGPEHLLLACPLQNLGAVAREWRKNLALAERYYRRADSIREKALGPNHPDVAGNLINIGNLYHTRGDYAKASEIYLRSVGILEKTRGPYERATLIGLGNTATNYAAMGDLANAITFQKRVDEALEAHIASNLAIGSERQKLGFLNSASERTDRTVSLSVNLAPGNPAASALAALVLLQRKGRVLDAMSDSMAGLRRRYEPQDRALLDQLNQTGSQLARLVLNGPGKVPIEEHQARVKELEGQKEKLEAEISQHSAEFRAGTQTVTLEAVQAAIPENAALAEFAVYRPFNPKARNDSDDYGAPRYAVFVISRAGAVKEKDLGDAAAIDRAVTELRLALRDPARRDVQTLARLVDEKVLRPLRALVGDATHLLISPDGSLNLVPFEALLDERGRYEINRYLFTYLTSGRDLLRMKVARPSMSEAVVVANPLFGEPANAVWTGNRGVADRASQARAKHRSRSVTPGNSLARTYFAPLSGTAQEAQIIKSLFPEATLLIGPQATKSAVQSVIAPRILHIATHGFFLSDATTNGAPNATANPTTDAAANATTGMRGNSKAAGSGGGSAAVGIDNLLLRSGLALAGANLHRKTTDDGLLTALEASGLNLWGTKLVVLSACDTGIGEIRKGEGVYGLRRALVLAGAESLVMSLWPVSDYVSRELMAAYYKNLKSGEGGGEALRQVQLDMLKRKGRQHPFYWASFIHSGEWANLDGKR